MFPVEKAHTDTGPVMVGVGCGLIVTGKFGDTVPDPHTLEPVTVIFPAVAIAE